VKKNPASALVMLLALAARLKVYEWIDQYFSHRRSQNQVHDSAFEWLSLDSEDYNQLIAVGQTN
jgi:hypothetical protein